MKIYIIWNIDENRPAVMRDNYGAICVFLSKENAQAAQDDYLPTVDKNQYLIKEFTI